MCISSFCCCWFVHHCHNQSTYSPTQLWLRLLSAFIMNVYNIFVKLYFTYLEINPLVVVDSQVYVLDLAARLDQTAEYLCHELWNHVSFPPPFGRGMIKEVRSHVHQS